MSDPAETATLNDLPIPRSPLLKENLTSARTQQLRRPTGQLVRKNRTRRAQRRGTQNPVSISEQACLDLGGSRSPSLHPL
jgi:hypothetical protein